MKMGRKTENKDHAANEHEEPDTPKWNAREDEHGPGEPRGRQS